MVQHWNRWLFASVSRHFSDHRQTLPIFIEGQHRDTRNERDFMELRMDGPQYTELTKGNWHLYLEVNVLVQSIMDDVNYHRVERGIGIAVQAFTDILVYKYGNQVEDTGDFLGCLKLIQDVRSRERIQVYRFGQIEEGVKLEQASIEGHYEMNLDE